MIEFCIILNLFGLILSSIPRFIRSGNPFQFFFAVWFSVLIIYYSCQNSYIRPTDSFFAVLSVISSSWLVSLLAVSFLLRNVPYRALKLNPDAININNNRFYFLLIIVCFTAPFFYLRAAELSGGGNVFSVQGYIALRRSLTAEDGGYGILGYISVISLVLSSLVIVKFIKKEANVFVVVGVLALSVYFSYLSTGRTFFLMLFSCVVFPFISMGFIRVKWLFCACVILLTFFILVPLMTAKGLSFDLSLMENLESFLIFLRDYIVSPLVAMATLFDSQENLSYGSYTFRFIFAVINKLGFDVDVSALIRESVFVPMETNVYTVFDPYYRDYSVGGILVFSWIILFFHMVLFIKMLKRRGIYIFIYSIFLFPLVLQFFQDMYFTLLSQWIQTCFWFFIVLNKVKKTEMKYRVS